MQEPYLYNERFQVIHGAQYFVNGMLDFGDYAPRADGAYRTHFGPSISHAGVVYAVNSRNLSYALRRLTGCRSPEIPGADQLMRERQAVFIAAHQGAAQALARQYEPYFNEYKGSYQEGFEHHADAHDKRLLRIHAWAEMTIENLPFGVGPVTKSVLVKQKGLEYAKPGKKPRCIGDLGVTASLVGFRLCHYLKIAQDSECFSYRGGVFRFCKSPDPFALENVFEELIHLRHRAYFVCFSDDSCLSLQGATRPRWFNLDISSCDASHTDELFELIERIVPEGICRHDMELVTAQCGQTIRLVCVEDPRRVVLLRAVCRLLFSGSVLTTAINNLANFLIFMSIMDADFPDTCTNGVYDGLAQAISRTGYTVTGCEPLEHPEDLQFLKNSPVLDTSGRWRPMLNLGVLFRSSGTCHGDLPGRGALRDRAHVFQRGLLRCTYPYTRFELLNAMLAAIGDGDATLPEDFLRDLRFKVIDNPLYPKYWATTDSILRRYRATLPDYYWALEQLRHAAYGDHLSGDFFERVLLKDYGLGCCRENASYLNLSYNIGREQALPGF